MHRRTLVAGALVALVVPITATAQRKGKVARVGFLVMARNPGIESAFPRGLVELGYAEGSDVIIEWRSAEGRSDQAAALARELVQWGPDVIVAAGPEARIAVMQATATIPVVVVGGSDPVAEGWAQSLAHPGGNVTGLTATYPELYVKKLELLRELIPGLSRVALVQDPNGIPPSVRTAQTSAMRTAARSLHMDVNTIEVRSPEDFEMVFRQASRERRQALIVVETGMMFAHRAKIAELGRKSSLPLIGEWKPSAAAGFLASYGADLSDLLRRSASYVDRILKGTKPGTLPIERPSKFELVINRKTAQTLGLTIPSSLLLRADQVID